MKKILSIAILLLVTQLSFAQYFKLTPNGFVSNDNSAFEAIMDLHGHEIPEENKEEVVNYFNKKSEKSNNEYGRKHYLDLANKFK